MTCKLDTTPIKKRGVPSNSSYNRNNHRKEINPHPKKTAVATIETSTKEKNRKLPSKSSPNKKVTPITTTETPSKEQAIPPQKRKNTYRTAWSNGNHIQFKKKEGQLGFNNRGGRKKTMKKTNDPTADWNQKPSHNHKHLPSHNCKHIPCHKLCAADCRELGDDFNVFSAYGSHSSPGVSLLVGRSLDGDVDFVFAGNGGWMVVADVAVKNLKFRLVVVYAPNIDAERVSFFRRLAPFLYVSKRLVLMGNWNVILDPKVGGS